MKKQKFVTRPLVSPDYIREIYNLHEIKKHQKVILGVLITEAMVLAIMAPRKINLFNMAFSALVFCGGAFSIFHYCQSHNIKPEDLLRWYHLFYAPNAPYDIDELLIN